MSDFASPAAQEARSPSEPTQPVRQRVLLLPGWQNSGAAHWQSRWEALPNPNFEFVRVQQSDWDKPLRGDWMIQLEEAVLAAPAPVLLAAHSMGCMLVAAWAAHSQTTHKVRAALLVAPGDPEREELRAVLKSWSPIVRAPLPFSSLLLASENDPFCDLLRAQGFAHSWGSKFMNMGPKGHLNAESGLGDWPEGQVWLGELALGSQ